MNTAAARGSNPGRSTETVLLTCFFLSGVSSLIYQVTWIRKLILIFGSTTFAVSTVLTVFMGGLALGSFLAGRLGGRIRRGPLVYGVMEIGIGLYGFLVFPILALTGRLYQGVWESLHPTFYSLSLIRLVLTSLVLLVPTTLMGATLPVLSKYYGALLDRVGFKVGRLYSLNTFGAVAGTFLAGFVLLPGLGLRLTILTAGGLNFLLGGAAILAGRRGAAAFRMRGIDLPVREEAGSTTKCGLRRIAGLPTMMLLAFALSGFAAMVFEVAWTRALSLILGSTTYAFSTMLSTFLIGLALGSWVASRVADRLRDPVGLLAFLLLFVGGTAYGGLFLFNLLPELFLDLFSRLALSQGHIVLAQFLLSSCVLIVPTLALGAVFPLIVRIYSRRAGEVGRIVGNVYSANTVGAILGSLLAGFALIPFLGARNSIVAAAAVEVGLGYALLAFFSEWRGKVRVAAAGGALLGATALGAWLSPTWSKNAVLAFDTLGRPEFTAREYHRPDDLVFYRDGATATVAVGRRDGSYYLAINGRINASDSGDMPTQVLLAQIPLLLAPRADRVLVIGWGSGMSVGSAAQYPPALVKSIEAVELERAVVEGSVFFEPANNRPLRDPRVRLIVDDGRNYLELERRPYDVIVSEPSHPWMTGVSNLFTRDFFEIVRSRLTEKGVFAQWLQTYQLSPENLKILVRTFRAAFPAALVFGIPDDSSDLILIGSRSPLPVDLDRIEKRMKIAGVRRDLERVEVNTVDDVAALLRMGGEEMDWFGADSPLNTDDNARIEFSAPRDLYLSGSSEESSAEIEALGVNLRRYLVRRAGP